MTVLIEFKTDVFRTALSCFLTIRGYLGWSRFYLSGDSLLCTSVCVSLSEEWRARPRSGLVCVLVSVGLVVIGDSSMVGVMVMIVNQIG